MGDSAEGAEGLCRRPSALVLEEPEALNGSGQVCYSAEIWDHERDHERDKAAWLLADNFTEFHPLPVRCCWRGQKAHAGAGTAD